MLTKFNIFTIYYNLENLEMPIIKEQIIETTNENKILDKNKNNNESIPQTSQQAYLEKTIKDHIGKETIENTAELYSKGTAVTNNC